MNIHNSKKRKSLKKIDKLRKLVQRYVKGTELVSETEFDSIKGELQKGFIPGKNWGYPLDPKSEPFNPDADPDTD